jgi:hypothetical protein
MAGMAGHVDRARAGRLMAEAGVEALLVAAPPQEATARAWRGRSAWRTRRAVCMFSPRGSARRRRWAISA